MNKENKETIIVVMAFIVIFGGGFGYAIYGASLAHNVEAMVGQPINTYHSDGITIVNYTVTYVAPGGQTFTQYVPISCSLYTTGSNISAFYQPAWWPVGASIFVNPLPKDC